MKGLNKLYANIFTGFMLMINELENKHIKYIIPLRFGIRFFIKYELENQWDQDIKIIDVYLISCFLCENKVKSIDYRSDYRNIFINNAGIVAEKFNNTTFFQIILMLDNSTKFIDYEIECKSRFCFKPKLYISSQFYSGIQHTKSLYL